MFGVLRDMFFDRSGVWQGPVQAGVEALQDDPGRESGERSGGTGVPGPWESPAARRKPTLGKTAGRCHRLPRKGLYPSASKTTWKPGGERCSSAARLEKRREPRTNQPRAESRPPTRGFGEVGERSRSNATASCYCEPVWCPPSGGSERIDTAATTFRCRSRSKGKGRETPRIEPADGKAPKDGDDPGSRQ